MMYLVLGKDAKHIGSDEEEFTLSWEPFLYSYQKSIRVDLQDWILCPIF